MQFKRALVVAAVTAMAGPFLTGCGGWQAPPAPYATQDFAGNARIDHPLSWKNYYPVEVLGHERWEFCFDPDTSGSICVPVSVSDYDRFDVGDRVVIRQPIGRLSVIDRP